MRVPLLRLPLFQDEVLKNTLFTTSLFVVVMYLNDVNRYCLFVHLIQLVCIHLVQKESREHYRRAWMSFCLWINIVPVMVHVIGAQEAPIMMHFFVNDGKLASRSSLLLLDALFFFLQYMWIFPFILHHNIIKTPLLDPLI